MKIEKETIQFRSFDFRQLKLNDLQSNYLSVLLNEKTIEGTFQFYLKQGWLINFKTFFELIELLLEKKVIENLSFFSYFKSYIETEKSFFTKFTAKRPSAESEKSRFSLAQFPFFRNLSANMVSIFQQNSEVISVPPMNLLLREGEPGRDMFAVLEGELAVYKRKENHRVRVASLCAGSVFGEGGFLLGQPRSADVVTTSVAKLVLFRYRPEVFEGLIKKDQAFHQQTRFWALHALMSSKMFQNLPMDTIDELLQSGKTRAIQPREILFQQNSPGSSFFILLQGHVQFFQNQKLINTLSQGGAFGEVALFYSGGLRTATAVALTEGFVMELRREDFYRIIGHNLILAKEIESLAQERLEQDRARHGKVA